MAPFRHFLLRNDDFLLRNDDFRLRNDDFLLKNVEFIIMKSISLMKYRPLPSMVRGLRNGYFK